jgi:hypothetical protein
LSVCPARAVACSPDSRKPGDPGQEILEQKNLKRC